ncbi:MAG TPA: SGNH/GDSL hydrolase family protein [Phycisphaerae bacterium]|mgnify:CR=1 FL=1|nr:SGNH/GDSL hydrolase family protein [Phycisphaerae bacterium]HQL54118.1 SGNH/GDSL hydrolase family protein [Phycisphaerae bacterium]
MSVNPDQANRPPKDRRGRVHAAAGRLLLASLLWSAAGCSDNRLLIPDPAVRYLAFGDSSTSGRAARSYPEILAERLGQPAGAMANEGSDGETAGAGLERLRQLLAARIYPNAEVLLYWEGGADLIDLIREIDGLLLFSPLAPSYPYTTRLAEALDRIQADIEAAIAAGQAAGLTVYVATYFSFQEVAAACDPMPLDVMLPAQAQNANGYVSLLNERIRQAAASGGAGVVDIASADDDLHASAANFVNCNHLSEAGNEIVAQVFVDALEH